MSHIAGSDRSDKKIYLDYAAFTPVDEEVLKGMLPYFDVSYTNASSLHESGRRSRQIIEKTRSDIAQILNCNSDEIIFTSGGTESDNLAILGVAHANRAYGNHIIVSAIEHKAVMESCEQLKKEGFEISYAPVDKEGMVDVEKLVSLITPQTILISVMYVNNEIGTVQPIKEIGKIIAESRKQKAESGNTHKENSQSEFSNCQPPSADYPVFHIDACQAGNLFSLNVEKLGVDLMSINSSKIYGPNGIGLLYKKSGIKIEPIIVGGDQENNLRSGTENVPNIVGFSQAILKAQQNKKEESKRLKNLQNYFIEELKNSIPNISFIVKEKYRSPAITHINIPNIEGESTLLKLDYLGVEVSTGSACSSHDLKPSHVLLAVGLDLKLIHGSLRFSFGKYTTKKELDYVLKVFPKIVEELNQMSALTITI